MGARIKALTKEQRAALDRAARFVRIKRSIVRRLSHNDGGRYLGGEVFSSPRPVFRKKTTAS
jgi:hypothetical protein